MNLDEFLKEQEPYWPKGSKQLPPVQERKGQWVEHKDYSGWAYLCSECNYFTTVKSNYCPNCGKHMEGGKCERLTASESKASGIDKSEVYNPPKMVGWICPVCGQGLSPFTAVCPCKNGGKG